MSEPNLTCAQINFFDAEIDNERHGGVVPATLDSAVESLEQAPWDVVVSWADDETVQDEVGVQEFVTSIYRLREEQGGSTTLRELLRNHLTS